MSGHKRFVSNKAKQKTSTDMPYWKDHGFLGITLVFPCKNSSIIRTIVRLPFSTGIFCSLWAAMHFISVREFISGRWQGSYSNFRWVGRRDGLPSRRFIMCHHYSPVNISHTRFVLRLGLWRRHSTRMAASESSALWHTRCCLEMTPGKRALFLTALSANKGHS